MFDHESIEHISRYVSRKRSESVEHIAIALPPQVLVALRCNNPEAKMPKPALPCHMLGQQQISRPLARKTDDRPLNPVSGRGCWTPLASPGECQKFGPRACTRQMRSGPYLVCGSGPAGGAQGPWSKFDLPTE